MEVYKIFNYKEEGPIPEAAIAHLVEWGLIPKEGEYKCPHGHILKLVAYDNLDGWLWRCFATDAKRKQKTNKCGYRVSLRTGTFFERCKLPISKILVFILLWCKNLPLSIIMEEAEIKSLKTGVDWNNFCREVVIYSSFRNTLRIGGPGVEVEIDESKIGKRKYHKGHFVEGQWVFGGVERGTNRCFIVPVEDSSSETLLALIRKYIVPGSVIVSDCWKSYDRLSKEGYIHHSVNHSVNFKDPITQQHTNTIEGLWGHLKASLPNFNRRKIFFTGYIQKFIFLRSCKAEGKSTFLQFCQYAGNLYDPKVPKFEEMEEEETIDLLMEEEEAIMLLNTEVDGNENEINPLG